MTGRVGQKASSGPLLAAAGIVMSLSVLAVEPTAVFDDVVVRQMWPWQTNVVIECSVRNVNCPSRAVIALTADGQAVGAVPASAFKTSCSFVRGGKLHVEFDPKSVPSLVAKGRVGNLRVDLSAEAVDSEDVLYVIYDLERPGCSEIVTTDELRSGLWGAWEERIWSNSGIVQTGKPVWTGVTNDVYKLTKLVMRRIPAGSFKMGYADSADVGKGAPNIAQRDIMLTKPYYMGVFPVTRKQLRLMTGSTNQDSLNYPTVSDTFDQIRGAYTTAGGPYDWPTDKTVDPNSFIGKFRARTGAALDLPTEAQWEKAARAGSAGVYYDGCEQTHMAERNAIAWNTSNADGVMHPVGQLKPNNYGLYDVLGNCWEWVLDWMAGAVDIELTDPEGPTAAGAGYWSENGPKRMLKGASFAKDYTVVTLYQRTQNPVSATGGSEYGWRLAMPATEIDGGEVAAAASAGISVDVTEGWQWMTAGANPGVVQWTWPSEAQSARLTVTGRRTNVTQTYTTDTSSYDLRLTLPADSRYEDVLDIRLEFYKSADASGAVLTEFSAKGLGVLRATPSVSVSASDFAVAEGRHQVLPVAENAALTIDGVVQPTGIGPCWFGWTGSYGAHELKLGEGDVVPVQLRPSGLAIVIR